MVEGGRLSNLSSQLSYASGVKAAARIRSRCTLEEWELVLDEAKILYNERLYYRSRGIGR